MSTTRRPSRTAPSIVAAALGVTLTLSGCAPAPASGASYGAVLHPAGGAASPSRSAAVAADSAAAARAVEAVVADSLFNAVARFDYPAVGRALTPTFELEEDSLRLSGEQFAGMVRGFEGKASIVYRLDDFRTQVHGPSAWTSYRNHATLTPAGGAPMPLEWLETAVLVRDATGRWRIDRLHSTPIHAAH